jgi:hypothetical protein
MAVYFPRGEHLLKEIEDKFRSDLEGARHLGADGFAFVTNQELRLAERKSLRDLALPIKMELFHLERLTAILDRPEMAAVRKQFLGIGDDDPKIINLGGLGGAAPGAGGGGGGVLGNHATGGAGGPGGDIQLQGRPALSPGAGGGGAGALGEGALGGEGGGGGEIVGRFFRAEDLPPSIEVTVGQGGRGGENGGDGEDGGDTSFGDLLRAKGGKGGRAGKPAPVCPATPEEADKAISVCALYLAECVRMKHGMLDLLGAGWEYFVASSMPFDAEWPLVCSLSIGGVELGATLEFFAIVRDPDGTETLRERFLASRDSSPTIALRHTILPLRFRITKTGVWSINILSGVSTFGSLPIEVRHQS